MHVWLTKALRISAAPSPIRIVEDQKQTENVKCFSYLGSMITNDVRCTCEIKSSISVAKAALNKEENSFHQQTGHKFKGAIHFQLNWAILLCDAIPDGKKPSKLRSFDRQCSSPQKCTFLLSYTQRTVEFTQGIPHIFSSVLRAVFLHS